MQHLIANLWRSGRAIRVVRLAGAVALGFVIASATAAEKSATPEKTATAEKAKAADPKVTKDVTFDDVKLDLKKGDPYDAKLLTDKIKALDGRPIRIRGFILPSFQQTGIKQFVLVRDNMECCFGPGALLHDCILVEMIEPATATFTVRPVSVEGAFSIRELKGPDGKPIAIYHLDGKQVNNRAGRLSRLAASALCMVAVIFGPAGLAHACPFCTALGPTLCQRGQQATVTALAEVVAQQPGKPTQLRLHRVLAGANALKDPKRLDVPLDLMARAGSLVLVFGTGAADQSLEQFSWQATAVNETSYAYFARAFALHGSIADRLRYFAPFLEHADSVIAQDAYLEFGHASFDEVARVVEVFSMPRVRQWLSDPKVPPERKGFYGLVLGLSSEQPARRDNAAFLARLIASPEDDFRAGFDGILGGYLLLEGPRGYDLVQQRYLANPGAKDGDVRHALTALRFYHEYGHEVPIARQQVALRSLLDRPEFAAAAITDLARWQDWEPLARIRDLYVVGSTAQAELRRAIVGYLLACPREQASAALAGLRTKDPAGVAAAEQFLSRTTDSQSRD